MKIKKEPQCSSGQGRRQTKTIIIHSAFTLIDNITNFDKNRLLMGVCKIYAVSQKLQHFTFNQDFPRSTIIYCLKSSNGTVPVCWMGGCSEHRPARPQTKVFSELVRSSYMYTLIKTLFSIQMITSWPCLLHSYISVEKGCKSTLYPWHCLKTASLCCIISD